MTTGANIHLTSRRNRDASGAAISRGGNIRKVAGSARAAIDADLWPRTRLRLIIGIHLLDRLAADPGFAGCRLPSIRAVAAASGHHRNTVAAVYSDLRQLGLITCRTGSGSFSSRPGTRSHRDGTRLVCRESALAALLVAETRSSCAPVPSDGSAGGRELLMHPLHLVPPAGAACFPVAPSGETLSAVRRLHRGSTALVLSRSPTVRRLMRHTIRSIHGRSVGVVSVNPTGAFPCLSVACGASGTTFLFHDPGWRGSDRRLEHQPMAFLDPRLPCFGGEEPSAPAVRNG